MKSRFLLFLLAGLVAARFDNQDASFDQVISKLSAGERVPPALLAKRAVEWKRLYKTNPDEAFRIADETRGIRSMGQKSAGSSGLEEEVSGMGTVQMMCGKPQSHINFDERSEFNRPLQWTSFERPGDICFHGATINDAFYLLRLSNGHPLARAPQSKISLRGYAFASDLGAPEFFPRTSFQPLAVEPPKHRRLNLATCSPTTSPTTTLLFGKQGFDQKMCIVRYIMKDSLPVKDISGAEISDANFQTLVTQLNTFFMENSYGQLSFAPPTIFTVQGSLLEGVLNEDQMFDDWRVGNPGVWCTCDAEVIVFNYNLGGYYVPYGGLGRVSGQGIWVNGNTDVGLWAHELGHNLGFGHARHYQLTAPSASWQGNGIITEYGSQFDVMGSGLNTGVDNSPAYYGAAFRSFAMTPPWITSDQLAKVGAIIPGGALDVFLFPSDMGLTTPALSGNQKLAVEFSRPTEIVESLLTDSSPIPASIRFGRFFFEYKAKLKAPKAKTGLLVTSTPLSIFSIADRHCTQLDTNPQTTTSLDSFLRWGSTFSDCASAVHITAEQADCPGAAADSKGCARALIRNGLGGKNIVLVVTDGETGLTTSNITVGATVTLSASLSGYDTSIPTQVYFDWGDGTVSIGLSASRAWTSVGMKTVTVTANTLDSSYARVFYKVVVGSFGVARLISNDTIIDSNAQGKSFTPVGITSVNTGFTVTMMARFTNTSQINHDMFRLGQWSLYARYKYGDPYGWFFHQATGTAYSTNVPFFDRVTQAAVVVTKVGSVVTESIYIDGNLYVSDTNINTLWPSADTIVQVGAYANGRFLGGVVSRFNVYNYPLTPADLALDAQGVDLMSRSVTGQASSGCQEAGAATPSNAPSKVPSAAPSRAPTLVPSNIPSMAPSRRPTIVPSVAPTRAPVLAPSNAPSTAPSMSPSQAPSATPSMLLSNAPTNAPSSRTPTDRPSAPTKAPSNIPTQRPSKLPTSAPSKKPTLIPTERPSKAPSRTPTQRPSKLPTSAPSTKLPTTKPSKAPSRMPSQRPSKMPTLQPSRKPSTTIG